MEFALVILWGVCMLGLGFQLGVGRDAAALRRVVAKCEELENLINVESRPKVTREQIQGWASNWRLNDHGWAVENLCELLGIEEAQGEEKSHEDSTSDNRSTVDTDSDVHGGSLSGRAGGDGDAGREAGVAACPTCHGSGTVDEWVDDRVCQEHPCPKCQPDECQQEQPQESRGSSSTEEPSAYIRQVAGSTPASPTPQESPDAAAGESYNIRREIEEASADVAKWDEETRRDFGVKPDTTRNPWCAHARRGANGGCMDCVKDAQGQTPESVHDAAAEWRYDAAECCVVRDAQGEVLFDCVQAADTKAAVDAHNADLKRQEALFVKQLDDYMRRSGRDHEAELRRVRQDHEYIERRLREQVAKLDKECADAGAERDQEKSAREGIYEDYLKMRRERDELRDEVSRLRGIVSDAEEIEAEREADVESLRKERDELRAEVEDLRLRITLDGVGDREKESVELVELRAELDRLRGNLSLAAHKIQQHLDGQYSDGQALRAVLRVADGDTTPDTAPSEGVEDKMTRKELGEAVCTLKRDLSGHSTTQQVLTQLWEYVQSFCEDHGPVDPGTDECPCCMALRLDGAAEGQDEDFALGMSIASDLLAGAKDEQLEIYKRERDEARAEVEKAQVRIMEREREQRRENATCAEIEVDRKAEVERLIRERAEYKEYWYEDHAELKRIVGILMDAGCAVGAPEECSAAVAALVQERDEAVAQRDQLIATNMELRAEVERLRQSADRACDRCDATIPSAYWWAHRRLCQSQGHEAKSTPDTAPSEKVAAAHDKDMDEYRVMLDYMQHEVDAGKRRIAELERELRRVREEK